MDSLGLEFVEQSTEKIDIMERPIRTFINFILRGYTMKFYKQFFARSPAIVEEHMISTARGQIFCKKIYRKSCEDKIPLILLHGGPAVPHDYLLPIAESINDHPVIFYDQIGCGASEKPTLEDKDWAMACFVDELASVRDFFKIKQFHLYGHSWGAAISISYVLAQNSDSHVKSLVLASPLISVPKWAEDGVKLLDGLSVESRTAFLELEAKKIFSGPEYAKPSEEYVKTFLCRTQPWPSCFIEAIQKSSTESRYKLWGDQGPRYPNGLHKDLDLSSRLHELNLPVLITVGRYDSARPETLMEYQKLLPNSRIEILESASHMPHLEEPSHYIQILHTFIHQHDKEHSSTLRSKL